VPVTLKVPTHLKLTIEEKTFWRVDGSELIPVTSCRATRDVIPKVQYTEKIFLVDPVKPGAGSSEYGFTFKGGIDHSGKGQLEGLNYKITDTTITQSAQLLKDSLSFVRAFPKTAKGSTVGFGGGNENVNSLDVIQTTRVIAWSQFDINSENFEDEVMGFLDVYLNDKPCGPDSTVTTCDK